MAGVLIIIFTIIMVWCFDNPVLDSTVGDVLSDNMLSDKTTPGDPKHMKDLQQGKGATGQAGQAAKGTQGMQGAQGAQGGFSQPQPQTGIPMGFPMQPSTFPQPSIGGGFPMQQPQQMPAQQPGGSWASLKVGDFLGGICAVVLIICLGTCIFS
jgi:hypothetical protein